MEFRKPFFLLWEHLGLVMLCIVFDVLFFFALGFFTAPVSFEIRGLLLRITAVFSAGLNDAGRPASVLGALFSAGASSLWSSFLYYAAVFVLMVFLVYVIFQSLAWFFSMQIAGNRVFVWPFFRKFLLFNLFWFFLFIVYNVVDLGIDIGLALGARHLGIFTALNNVFLFFVAYFAVISYIGKGILGSFVLGWKKARLALLCFCVVFVYFLVINTILPFVFGFNYVLGTVLGILLFIPAITVARVFMIVNISGAK